MIRAIMTVRRKVISVVEATDWGTFTNVSTVLNSTETQGAVLGFVGTLVKGSFGLRKAEELMSK